MTLSTKLFAAILLATLLCTVVAAQESTQISAAVPRLVTYSGRARDAHGTPTSGVAGVTFTIYKEQEGGNPLWLETQNVNLDSQGRYSVQLGSTASNGLPVELFTSGEARWLGTRVDGGEEQPRVLLVSVPYALKAADAQTLGGLPASAFMLAGPPVNGNPASPETASTSATPATVPSPTSGTGTTDFLPLWLNSTGTLGNSVLFQSGTGSTAKVGINTTTPTSTLDVKGGATVRGNLALPTTGAATPSAGKTSQPEIFTASAFNSATSTAVSQSFRLEAEPVGNNTSGTSASLNLLFGRGTATPSETGLKIGSNGHITFAAGQTFPGTGTVTSVGLGAPNSDFTVSGSPVTGSGALALNWNVTPTSSDVANSIVKRDGTGSFNATAVNVNTLSAVSSGLSLVATSSGTSDNTTAISGTSTATSNAEKTYGVGGSSNSGLGAGVFGVNNNAFSGNGVYGIANNNSGAVEGQNFNAGGGAGVVGAGAWGFYTENNVHQGLGSGGWVKAMIVYDDVIQRKMLRCFNSNLAGAAATTVPCGFSTNFFTTGVYGVDFGFEVDNRFLSANAFGHGGHYYVAGASPNPSSASQVIVNVFDVNSLSLQNGIFTVIVY
jgi:hypothetical protein